MFQYLKKWLAGIYFCFFSASVYSHSSNIVYPTDSSLYDQYRWAGSAYYGVTCTDKLVRITKFEFHRWPEHIISLELAHTLNQENFLRRLVNPIVGVVQLAFNTSIRNGTGESQIYEFDPYLAFRWANLPWNNLVTTSIALGEGVSYVTSYIALEKHYGHKDTKRFLNYLMLEGTFAAPQYPHYQVFIRLHHRSGAFGLYGGAKRNAGSNDIGLGLRYLFD